MNEIKNRSEQCADLNEALVKCLRSHRTTYYKESVCRYSEICSSFDTDIAVPGVNESLKAGDKLSYLLYYHKQNDTTPAAVVTLHRNVLANTRHTYVTPVSSRLSEETHKRLINMAVWCTGSFIAKNDFQRNYVNFQLARENSMKIFSYNLNLSNISAIKVQLKENMTLYGKSLFEDSHSCVRDRIFNEAAKLPLVAYEIYFESNTEVGSKTVWLKQDYKDGRNIISTISVAPVNVWARLLHISCGLIKSLKIYKTNGDILEKTTVFNKMSRYNRWFGKLVFRYKLTYNSTVDIAYATRSLNYSELSKFCSLSPARFITGRLTFKADKKIELFIPDESKSLSVFTEYDLRPETYRCKINGKRVDSKPEQIEGKEWSIEVKDCELLCRECVEDRNVVI